MQRIVVYGGSFDPMHKGHIAAIRQAVSATKATKVILVPANIPPLKERRLSPAEDRLKMIAIGMRQLPKVKYEISHYELNRGGLSYTYDTLVHLKKQIPDAKFFLLIGTDQANQFDLWKNAHLISAMCSIVCVRRTTYLDKKKAERYGIKLLAGKEVFASSTELRSRVDQSMALPGVNDYVNKHLLYLPERIQKWQSKERWGHTLRVVSAAVAIAKANKLSPAIIAKTRIAAYFHDLAKDFTDQDLFKYARKYLPGFSTKKAFFLHAVVAADYVRRFYGMTDKTVISAIANHTLPLAKRLSAADMVVYVADKVEPKRKYPSRKQNMALALHDYKKAFARVFCQQYERFAEDERLEEGKALGELYARLKNKQ